MVLENYPVTYKGRKIPQIGNGNRSWRKSGGEEEAQILQDGKHKLTESSRVDIPKVLFASFFFFLNQKVFRELQFGH